jgi:hypothetical protein
MYTFLDEAMAQDDKITPQKLLERTTAQFGTVVFRENACKSQVVTTT